MVSREAKGGIVGGVGAVITIIAAIFAFYGFDNIVKGQLENTLRLDKKDEGYKNFKETPIDVVMKFFAFNITNWEDLDTMGQKWRPNLQEVGPYAYVEKRVKGDIKFLSNDEKVEFTQGKTFFFDASQSGPGLTEDDEIYLINAPILGVLDLILPILPPTFLPTIASLMNNEPVNAAFMKGSIKDILFSGAESNFLGGLVTVLENFGSLIEGIPELPPNIIPIPNNKTGFALYPKNGTFEGPFVVYTGKAGLDNYQELVSYQGKPYLEYWKDQLGVPKEERCNIVRGTDGTVFKPYLKKTDKLGIFTTDTCRVLDTEFTEEVTHLGIDGYRFQVPSYALQSHEVNPDNLCYCYPDESACMGAGVINLVSCMHVPVYLSLPHFLEGDDVYFNAVDGLERKPEIHSTFLDVEPLTGIPLRAAKRIQMNFKLRSYDLNRFPEILKKIPDGMVLPILWVEEYGELNKELADDFKSRIMTPMKAIGIVKWVLLAFGLFLLLVGIALYVWAKRRNSGTSFQ